MPQHFLADLAAASPVLHDLDGSPKWNEPRQFISKELIGKQLGSRVALRQNIHKSPGGQEIGKQVIFKRPID